VPLAAVRRAFLILFPLTSTVCGFVAVNSAWF
jgi:hypothetical protein